MHLSGEGGAVSNTDAAGRPNRDQRNVSPAPAQYSPSCRCWSGQWGGARILERRGCCCGPTSAAWQRHSASTGASLDSGVYASILRKTLAASHSWKPQWALLPAQWPVSFGAFPRQPPRPKLKVASRYPGSPPAVDARVTDGSWARGAAAVAVSTPDGGSSSHHRSSHHRSSHVPHVSQLVSSALLRVRD